MQSKHFFMKCTEVYREIFVAWVNLKVQQFLRAFGKLRKVTTSFVVNVRLSTRNNSVPTRWIFMKFDIWAFSENLSRKTRLIKIEQK